MGGHIFVNFSSDDYLDLAADPRLARAAARASLRYGCGAGASHFFSGSLPPHRALERALAKREGFEAALTFDSTITANLAILSSLAGPRDAIFCATANSGSLVDGCFLAGARTHRYDHKDLSGLDKLLRDRGARAARRLIATETVFGMDGDLAPLAEILLLAERYDSLVVLDESHATGVIGDRGRGLTDDLPIGIPGRHRVIKTGSLSKAYGSQGGFVCGPRNLLDAAAKNSRLVANSSALAIPAAAAALRALALADLETDRRRRALALAERLRYFLETNGQDPGQSRSQIVSVVVRQPRLAERISRRLEILGLLVPAVCPPLVPADTARLRISVTAGHTDADVDRLVKSLSEVRAALVV
jgi:8-amino-7-oxononanoate synthase